MMTLVLGGARSGKSRVAQRMALEQDPAPVYLATSRRWDDDHAARIARHRAERDARWSLVEDETTIARPDLAGRTVVVDCVTLWLTNWFVDLAYDVDRVRDEARRQIDALTAIDAAWILVSNELGMAPHAPTEAGRKFADLAGLVNQDIAARADRVTLVVAGLPLALKGGAA